MKKSSWPEHQWFALLSCALLVAVACLPSSATEPTEDEQVSSRKSNTQPPASTTSADKKVTDKKSADKKPDDVKPADVKPVDKKPVDKKPDVEVRPADAKAEEAKPQAAPSNTLELTASHDEVPLKNQSGAPSKLGTRTQSSPTSKAAPPLSKTNPPSKDGNHDEVGSGDKAIVTPARENVLRSKPSEGNKPNASGKPSEGNKPNEAGKVTNSKTKSGDGKSELSIEAQQQKDQGECPGSEGSKVAASKNVNDIPLEQDDHPFDAPVAESEDHIAKPKTPARPAKVERPRAAPVESTRSDSLLEERINLCMAHYYRHQESLAKRSPWAVMHTILPYGVETNVIAGNREVNAIGWMCYNGVCKTQRMFQSTSNGFRTNVGPGVQGHEGQFLAILAQSSVPRSFPILVGKTRYTVSDLIRYEMVTCREKSELTFKLIGLSHYLSPQQTWRDDRGNTWNLEKLVREELDQPVVGAACGGTHRLMGLSYALMMRRRYNQPINNHWARADAYIQDFVQYAWTLQNPDGSFSTDWFEGRANEPNMERKVQTTGHILEWLVFTLPDDQLNDPRLTKSVEFLLSQIYDHRENDWPIGPRGHSLRAISLYNQRYFGAPTGQLKSYLAQAGYLNEVR